MGIHFRAQERSEQGSGAGSESELLDNLVLQVSAVASRALSL